jgi:hypothetical protein
MKFRIGIENKFEGVRSIAWVVDHPGCFAYGGDEQEAVVNSVTAIRAYVNWINEHEPAWLPLDEMFEPRVVQVWTDYLIDDDFERVEEDGYFVEPFFECEWKPLTDIDIDRGLKLLAWSRADLLSVLEKLTPEQWAAKKEGERWDIAGIVNHISGGELWYLDRFGLAPSDEDVPEEAIERLTKVRGVLNDTLPALKGSKQVIGMEGEFWSPRKLIRRAIWHERDHIEHIQKLLSQVNA